MQTVESHIRQFPECTGCPLAKEALQRVSSHWAESDIIFTQCVPTLRFGGFFGTNIFTGFATDEGRIHQLKSLNGGEFTMHGEMIRVGVSGPICPHLKNQ